MIYILRGSSFVLFMAQNIHVKVSITMSKCHKGWIWVTEFWPSRYIGRMNAIFCHISCFAQWLLLMTGDWRLSSGEVRPQALLINISQVCGESGAALVEKGQHHIAPQRAAAPDSPAWRNSLSPAAPLKDGLLHQRRDQHPYRTQAHSWKRKLNYVNCRKRIRQLSWDEVIQLSSEKLKDHQAYIRRAMCATMIKYIGFHSKIIVSDVPLPMLDPSVNWK